MTLPEELISRLDFKSAVRIELKAANKLLPRRRDRQALRPSADAIANNIRNRLTKGIGATRADVLFVDKNRRGTRPISELSLIDRATFRAIVELIRAALPETLASRVTHKEFREAPLSAPSSHYVSTTDVTSFYEFIDHEILAQELEAQSGEGLAVDALMTFLYEIMGRRVGIPQIHTASDVLGDTYVDIVRRRLWRAGFTTYAYSDDFRIVTTSLAEAKSALELCAREARELGLALNESKTFTYGRTKYEESLEEFTQAELELFTEEQLDEFVSIRASIYDDFDDDGDEEEEEEAEENLGFGSPIAAPEDDDAAIDEDENDDEKEDDDQPSEAQERAASRALEAWSQQIESPDHEPRLLATAESLLRISLPILGSAGSLEPLDRASEILRYAPSLTPAVASYIEKLARHGQEERQQIRRTLDHLVSESSFSTWQETWLAEAAGSVPPAKNPYGHYEWLGACLKSENSALAAVAASALGRLGKADADELKHLIDLVGPAWKHLVLWGLAKQDLSVAMDSADDKIDRLLVEAVASGDNP
ncbi:hypothetical protein G3N30_15150 [Microbacterium lacticum]|uniref:RNA-directed DNA polymerase n=1 Tax=Microbacterium lacticum TaxID=33885 RepID=UPI0018B03F98|nr:RNA-directed DNA polymerase [Microbacterium lacticum]MBF9337496.1 hypothetical protein [Microbacterium lacticum]